MTNSRAQHLVTVWNPRYAADAMEAHLRLLLECDAAATKAGNGTDNVFVWWGKVRSGQRQQPMPHLADIVALGRDSADRDDDHETHLYLTDYQSLYVADVSAIVTDDPRLGDARVPAYYTQQGLNCDCWFEISDIRLLVRDDMAGVMEELGLLRNTRYADRPVSLSTAVWWTCPCWYHAPMAAGTSMSVTVSCLPTASCGRVMMPSRAALVLWRRPCATITSAPTRGARSNRGGAGFSRWPNARCAITVATRQQT